MQRSAHGLFGTRSIHRWRGNVRGIPRHPIPHQFRINGNVPLYCMLQFFQYENCGSFCNYKPTTMNIKRTRINEQEYQDVWEGWVGCPEARARSWRKPDIQNGEIPLSSPPATTTCASPCWIHRIASPMACAPLAHAVEGAAFGPVNPYRMLTFPAAILTRILGTR